MLITVCVRFACICIFRWQIYPLVTSTTTTHSCHTLFCMYFRVFSCELISVSMSLNRIGVLYARVDSRETKVRSVYGCFRNALARTIMCDHTFRHNGHACVCVCDTHSPYRVTACPATTTTETKSDLSKRNTEKNDRSTICAQTISIVSF